MPDSVQIEFPRAQVSALMAQMERAGRELGKPIAETVRWAARNVSEVMAGSTRVAKKVRTVVALPARRSKGWKQYDVTAYKGGKESHFIVRAKTLSEARHLKAARVRRYGLAKAAWLWGKKLLGRSAAIGFASPAARGRLPRAMAVNKRLTGDNPEVRITNKLRYATDALRGGPQDVNTAMGRAAKSMMHQIDSNIRKKLTKR